MEIKIPTGFVTDSGSIFEKRNYKYRREYDKLIANKKSNFKDFRILEQKHIIKLLDEINKKHKQISYKLDLILDKKYKGCTNPDQRESNEFSDLILKLVDTVFYDEN